MKTDKLTSLSKKILIQAVGVSLDAAGISVCGPAWPYVKRILNPVVDELKSKYPKLFPDDGEGLFSTDEQAEKVAEALSKNIEFQNMLDKEFENLKEGQEEITKLLIQQGETLQDINKFLDKTSQTSSESLERMKNIEIRLDQVYKAILQPKATKELTIDEIENEVSNLQYDALRWISVEQNNTAKRCLDEAREIIADGFIQEPLNPDLIALRGYIEKTQSQINNCEGNYETAISDFDEATKYFDAALKLDPTNISALNGMVDVYIYLKDYDRAIKLGKTITKENPDYGAAYWDLMIAIEAKMEHDNILQALQNDARISKKDLLLLQELKTTYQILEKLMKNPEQSMVFSTTDQNHVHQKLKILGQKLKSHYQYP